MADQQSFHKVEMGSDRNFGQVFAVVFVIIALWPIIFGSGSVRVWALIAAAVFLIVSFVAPKLFAPLNKIWFKFGMLLAMIIAPLVMMLVFFLAVTPTALIARLFKKDFLKIRPSVKNQDTFWIVRDKSLDKSQSMDNQF